MIDETIKEALSKRDGKYKFNDLLTFIESTGITYKDRELCGPLAIATLDYILLDINMIDHYDDRLLFFIILHETAHYKRITKYGRNWLLEGLSIADYENFTNFIFKEEIIADRYACKMFYHFNKNIYSWENTQQLNLIEKQKAYAPLANLYFGKIQNNEEIYTKLIESFIK